MAKRPAEPKDDTLEILDYLLENGYAPRRRKQKRTASKLGKQDISPTSPPLVDGTEEDDKDVSAPIMTMGGY